MNHINATLELKEAAGKVAEYAKNDFATETTDERDVTKFQSLSIGLYLIKVEEESDQEIMLLCLSFIPMSDEGGIRYFF